MSVFQGDLLNKLVSW